jgi:hypothetical protein
MKRHFCFSGHLSLCGCVVVAAGSGNSCNRGTEQQLALATPSRARDNEAVASVTATEVYYQDVP